MHNNYSSAPDKIQIKKEMLSNYQLKTANFYNISIAPLKKLGPNIFYKEKYMLHHENWQFYLRLGLKLKKRHRVLLFNQSQWLKPYVQSYTKKE